MQRSARRQRLHRHDMAAVDRSKEADAGVDGLVDDPRPGQVRPTRTVQAPLSPSAQPSLVPVAAGRSAGSRAGCASAGTPSARSRGRSAGSGGRGAHRSAPPSAAAARGPPARRSSSRCRLKLRSACPSDCVALHRADASAIMPQAHAACARRLRLSAPAVPYARRRGGPRTPSPSSAPCGQEVFCIGTVGVRERAHARRRRSRHLRAPHGGKGRRPAQAAPNRERGKNFAARPVKINSLRRYHA
jgi:hypothetical protein